MNKICIFGAGGFAKEVYWLALQCGYEVDAFIDTNQGGFLCGIKIMDDNYFNSNNHKAVVAVGSPILRKKITEQIIYNHGYDVFQTLIAPSANLMGSSVIPGYGSVICANCILTCDIVLGEFSQLNLATTIGHDVKTGSYFTTAPQAIINGNVNIGNCVYFGTNASTVENISICDNVIIGAAACVSKDIKDIGTYIGVPAKKLIKIK